MTYDNDESALKALMALQGTVINGCRCTIEISKASRSNKRLCVDRSITFDNNGKSIIISKKQMILVSDINNNLNDQHLKLLCNNFGTVIDIIILNEPDDSNTIYDIPNNNKSIK